MTTKVISPGLIIFRPFSRGSSSHAGGTMLETATRLHCWMPASLSASSKDWSCSLCLPTPLVRKKYFGIIVGSEIDCTEWIYKGFYGDISRTTSPFSFCCDSLGFSLLP